MKKITLEYLLDIYISVELLLLLTFLLFFGGLKIYCYCCHKIWLLSFPAVTKIGFSLFARREKVHVPDILFVGKLLLVQIANNNNVYACTAFWQLTPFRPLPFSPGQKTHGSTIPRFSLFSPLA